MAVNVSEVLLASQLMDNVLRPVLTASRPSQTMATMGPLNMSAFNQQVALLDIRIATVVERLTGNETGEERLLGEVGIVLLEELTRRRDQLQSGELEAIDYRMVSIILNTAYQWCNSPTGLEARDDGSNEATLCLC